MLNGEGSGPITTLCVPSDVAAGYAPPGASLVCVSVNGDTRPDADVVRETREQLGRWFGQDATGWRLLVAQ